jgi:hypothetical protein
MAFVVEDGTGKNDGNSYCPVADADAYHADLTGSTVWAAAITGAKQAALMKATQYLDLQYGTRWRGYRANGFGDSGDTQQALDWPRVEVYDVDGWPYNSYELPARLVHATCEMALRFLQGDDPLATVTEPGALASESVTVGPISERKDYLGSKPYGYIYRKVDALVRPLITGGGEILRG